MERRHVTSPPGPGFLHVSGCASAAHARQNPRAKLVRDSGLFFNLLMSRCHGKRRRVQEEVPWQRITCWNRRVDTLARCCVDVLARSHTSVCARVSVRVCVTEMLNPPWCLSHHFLCSGEQSESCDIRVSLRTHSRSAQAAAVFGCIGAAIGTQHIPSVSSDAALCNTLVLSCLLF